LIFSRFKKLEEDVTPYVSNILNQPGGVLVLNSQRENPYDSKTRIELSLSDTNRMGISSSRKSRREVPKQQQPQYLFAGLLEKHLQDKFVLVYMLPFIDEADPKAEFYIVSKKSDNSYYLIKVFDYSRHQNIESGIVITLQYKLADSTLGQILETRKQSKNPFDAKELKSLFHDCVITLYHFQRAGCSLVSLHPDFIFYDKTNQIFHVLPVSPPSNYDPKKFPIVVLPTERNMEVKTSISHEKTSILGHPEYLSPLLRQGFDKGIQETYHNPYKSCVFSLGLILLEGWTLEKIERYNSSKARLYETIAKHPLFITSSIIGKDYIIHCPNILELLLNFDEEERPDFITLYFQVFTDLPAFSDPLHPQISPPIIDEKTLASIKKFKETNAGQVTLYYEQGGKYVGKVMEYNGQIIRHGHGCFYDPKDNLIFDGIWHQDFPKNGIYIYNEDYRYEGTWEGFFHEGKGVLYFRDSPLYEGDWQNFKYHGYGKLYYENGNLKYEGEFKLSMKHGTGKSYYPDGSLYHVGFYKEGKMNDRGTIYWPDGNINFEGEILVSGIDNIFMKGTFYEESQPDKKGNLYVGELFNNKYHGKGARYDSKGNTLDSGDWYLGELIKGEPQDRILTAVIPTYSNLRTEYEIPREIKLSCKFITDTVREGCEEFELYLDFNSEKPHLSIDFSEIPAEQSKKVFSVIIRNPYFKNIRELVLSKFPRQKPDLEFKILLESYNLKNLKTLKIIHTTQFTDTMCKILSESHSLVSLNEFSMIECGNFTSEGIKALFNCAFLSNLQVIRIKNPTGFKDRSIIKSLAESLYLTNLRKITLSQCYLGPNSLKFLFNAPDILKSLVELNVSRNNIGNQGCQDISEAVIKFPQLKKLNLKDCCIDAQGVAYLASASCLQRLISLNLSNNSIGDEGCKHIANSKILINIERIILNDCDISQNGVKALCQSPIIKFLKILSFSNNQKINNEAAQSIAECPYFFNLNELFLDGCSLTIQGIGKICSSRNLARLRLLKIFGENIGKLIADDLKRELGIDNNLEIK